MTRIATSKTSLNVCRRSRLAASRNSCLTYGSRANKSHHSMKFGPFFGPFIRAVNTRTVGLKNPGKSPLAWILPSPREASPLVWRFFCGPGRARFLGYESSMRTRHREVLAERHRYPPQRGAGKSLSSQDVVQRWSELKVVGTSRRTLRGIRLHNSTNESRFLMNTTFQMLSAYGLLRGEACASAFS
jgi:hypothetical protein